MIGTIITVRISIATLRFAPVSCTTYWTERLRAWEMKLRSTHGAIARIPISPYTTDGTAASSRTTGSIARAQRAGANSTMNTAAKIENDEPDDHGQPGRHDRAPQQRPRAEVVDRSGPVPSAR